MAGGGNGGQDSDVVKIEEVNPHPVMETLSGIHYCVNSTPPWPEAVILGFQHYLLTVGMIALISTLIVPQMGGGNFEKAMVIQNMLFASGLNTLLQSFFGTRLPAVIGSSYTFVIPATTIVLAGRYRTIGADHPYERFEKTMRGIQGALIIASIFQISMGCFGFWRNIVRYLSPLSMVPLVTFTGLGLYHLGFPHYLNHYLKPTRSIYNRFALIISTAIVWTYAQILASSGVYNHKSPQTQSSCRSNPAALINAAPWVCFPRPFLWGKPSFHLGEAVAMIAASLIALTESTGTFLAVARYGSATPIPPSILSRSAAWLGLGTLLNAVFGSVTGAAASVENAGLLALARVGSRRVIQISAAFMIFFSIFSKFGAVFASVPLPIIAAAYCIFFGYVSSAGLSFLQFCNLNSFRTIFILGFSCFMGISVPDYFREYHLKSNSTPLRTRSQWFKDTVTVIFMSSSMVAALVGLFLDNTVERGEAATRKDNGAHWWERFILFTKDIRNVEFYSLPCRLNEYFPPL
ncbi:hypothetical protein Nepgr_012337 [Nepenthes gracilis]|uniref:Nucleobase-ascorbate transporter 10 n=1 Tax=Nepenthes gracilis TaxID=150966 RepID=A0AAD3SHC2_NEPGR|nr:hypothetical protein Nepgr_012337 [Nepenthes gracilis]